jgi:YVTN family beta-propeller protein
MRTRTALAALLLASSGCATSRPSTRALQPLVQEGEVHVYALPLPREAERLSFELDRVSLRRKDGTEVPLQLAARELPAAEPGGQRLVAWGRVPSGDYTGLSVATGSAALARDGERSRLLVDPEPARVDIELRVDPRTASVVWLSLRTASVRADYSFAPDFSAVLAPQTPLQVAIYCTNSGAASVSVIDRGPRLVTGVLPVAGTPRGMALDPLARRGYVALYREDQLEILDLAAGATLGTIRLAPGDGPTELGVAADGALVVLNERSRTLSFVDPVSAVELGRVPVGDWPAGLLVDRARRRAFVANRGSGTVTVVDLAARAVFGTIGTDPEPLDTALNFDGTRLYAVHRGSAYVASFDVPSLAPVARVYVGLGITAVKVDPRSDLIYLSRGDERRITVHDPISLQPVDAIEMPGAVSHMTIDDAENALLALVPERRAVAVVDLTSRKLLAEIPVGADPYTIALVGERP